MILKILEEFHDTGAHCPLFIALAFLSAMKKEGGDNEGWKE